MNMKYRITRFYNINTHTHNYEIITLHANDMFDESVRSQYIDFTWANVAQHPNAIISSGWSATWCNIRVLPTFNATTCETRQKPEHNLMPNNFRFAVQFVVSSQWIENSLNVLCHYTTIVVTVRRRLKRRAAAWALREFCVEWNWKMISISSLFHSVAHFRWDV